MQYSQKLCENIAIKVVNIICHTAEKLKFGRNQHFCISVVVVVVVVAIVMNLFKKLANPASFLFIFGLFEQAIQFL